MTVALTSVDGGIANKASICYQVRLNSNSDIILISKITFARKFKKNQQEKHITACWPAGQQQNKENKNQGVQAKA